MLRKCIFQPLAIKELKTSKKIFTDLQDNKAQNRSTQPNQTAAV